MSKRKEEDLRARYSKMILYTCYILLALGNLVNVPIVSGQYHAGAYDMASHHESGGSYGNEIDERPKVQLGIRLKIPAIKFELPRFNMPKITVSAKIRQPDTPRVINLPEINLDTSSKVSPPGAQHADQKSYYGGSYGLQPYASDNYGGVPESTQTFSFSTNEEQSLPAATGGYGTKRVNQGPSYQQQHQQIAYAGTNVHQSYSQQYPGYLINNSGFPSTHMRFGR